MNKYISQLFIRLKSKGRHKYLSEMKAYEYKSIEECKALQRKKLLNIVKYAIENVPYYKKVARNLDKTKLNEDQITHYLSAFPVLTKDILRVEWDNLKAENFSGDFYKNTSGGSTGEPVVFLQDIDFSEWGKATKTFFYELAGRKDGEKLVRLWGSERDILQGTQGIDGLINKHILSIYLLNTFRMSNENMRKYVEFINKKKPKVIEAYVQSIYELAKFIKNNNLNIFSPEGILTSAGNLTSDIKNLITEVFKCPVLNRYGSREAGDIACSCKESEALHVNVFNHYLEILNDNQEPCKAGEIGKIYITSLSNKIMPLIRYEIGDVGIPAENEKCSCGRGLPVFARILGRTVNLFKTKDDKLIDGEYFTHLFYFKQWVKQFQVIQKGVEEILIKIVLMENREADQSDIKQIEHDIKVVMGEGCKIGWSFMDYIEPSKSGKFLYTVSEVVG